MTTYRVNLIRSQRATERENLEERTLEKFIGDFETYEEAKKVYDELSIGTEVDKELLEITDIDTPQSKEEILDTTY